MKSICAVIFCLLVLFGGSFAHLEEHEETGHVVKKSSGHPRTLHDFEIIQSSSQVKSVIKTTRRSMFKRDKVEQPFPDDLIVQVEVYNTTVVFELTINDLLLHPEARLEISGKHSHWNQAIEHRYYKGTAKSALGSGWARLTLYGSPAELTFRGAFMQDNELYEIRPTDHFKQMKSTKVEPTARHSHKRLDHGDVDMVIYKYSDIEVLDPEAEKCGVDHTHEITGDRLFEEHFRSNPLDDMVSSKRVASGCPSSLKMLYMGVMADCSYEAVHSDGTTDRILNNWNLISALYESTFNIALGLVDIKVKTSCGSSPADPLGGTLSWNKQCSDSYTISNRLSDFSSWRGAQPADAGLWHLLSDCPTGSTIGIAWLNMLCQTASFDQTTSDGTEHVSGVGVTTNLDNDWVVSSHEIGHNFGAIHDCISSCTSSSTTCSKCSSGANGCDCNAQYIMNPSNNIASNTFSSGSQNTMCSRSAITGTCLAEPGSRSILNTGVCGNGIWEDGEECDCGGADACATQSCCRTNCTLQSGAECADANTACCNDCRILTGDPARATTCRPVAGECDVVEHCDGQNARCPTNKFKPDGTACTEIADAYCATGQCTNRVEQCKQVGQLFNLPEYNQDCLGSCRLFCQSSLQGCRYFPGNFLNGTKCGDNSGTCYDGVCSTGDFIGDLLNFIQDNLALVISASALFGLTLLGFLFWGCRKANRKDAKLGKSLVDLRGRLTQRRPKNNNNNNNNRAQNPRASAAGPGPRSSAAGAPQNNRASSAGAPQNNRASSAGQPRPRSHLQSESNNSGRTSMSGDFVGAGNTALSAPLAPEHPPEYSEVAMQVRCPLCQKMFPSEAAVNQHLDNEH